MDGHELDLDGDLPRTGLQLHETILPITFCAFLLVQLTITKFNLEMTMNYSRQVC